METITGKPAYSKPNSLSISHSHKMLHISLLKSTTAKFKLTLPVLNDLSLRVTTDMQILPILLSSSGRRPVSALLVL